MSDPTPFSLFKRSNGVYYIKYSQDGRTRWKSTRRTVKAEALKALSAFSQLCQDNPPSVLLSRFLEDYLAYSKVNHAPRTHECYRFILKRFLTSIGDCLLSQVSPKQVDDYKTRRLRAVSPPTLNIELRTLRAAFGVAVRWKLIKDSPFEGARLASVPERTPAFMSKTDFEKFLSVVSERWLKELAVFAVATGLRRGELLNLRWEDVDLPRRILHVQSSHGFTTKHGRRRTIPLGDAALSILQSKKTAALGPLVFTRKGRSIGESYLTHQFKKYVRLANLNENLHWHSMRHTFASWLVQDGASLFEVQKLLGHSSTTTTLVYSHLQPEQLHCTVNRIAVSLN
ncbi:MAG: tyrosine-type recombinase/integrase [Bacteroidota bacterium]